VAAHNAAWATTLLQTLGKRNRRPIVPFVPIDSPKSRESPLASGYDKSWREIATGARQSGTVSATAARATLWLRPLLSGYSRQYDLRLSRRPNGYPKPIVPEVRIQQVVALAHHEAERRRPV
jgi:hypothetical protein